MKYIKYFERIKEGFYYWRLDNRSIEHFKLSLLKTGLTPSDKCYQDAINIEADYVVKYKKPFYIGKGLNDFDQSVFYFYTYNISNLKGDFNYKGHINIKNIELKADKYNI